MYSSLAKYYDALMSDVDYDNWLKLVDGFISSSGGFVEDIANSSDNVRISGKDGKKGADLACGTGAFTIGLAKMGYQVFGVDYSPQMLEFAMQKAKNVGLKIDFIRQDINRFVSAGRLDFVTCMCDGVNYLKNPQGLFESVAASLKTGGVFIFDISTEYKLTSILASNTFTTDENGIVYIWQNSLKKGKVDMTLTFFERLDGKQGGQDNYKKSDCNQGDNNGDTHQDNYNNGANTYIRFDETQIQYIHQASQLITLLSPHFNVSIYGENGTKRIKPNEKRIHFVATKKGVKE